MSNTIPSSVVMMDALRHAEDLAYRNPESLAVVYRRIESSATNDGRYESGSTRIFVRLADDEAPQNAHVVTTVSRKPLHRPASEWLLKDAVRHMVDNLPRGLRLADRALIEYYPRSNSYPGQDARVFAYEFFSTEGLNVGTWIPDTSINGVNFQPGFEGRGRIYQGAFVDGQVVGPTKRIDWMIAAALVTDLDPGDCTERYLDGWRRAEASLRNGAHPDDDGPQGAHEETFNGFIGRMARERELRASANDAAMQDSRGALEAPVGAEPIRRMRP